MKVFKFGGASVKSADAIRNVASILSNTDAEHLLVVQSAMGKMTNHLEGVVNRWENHQSFSEELEAFRAYHEGIATEIGLDPSSLEDLQSLFQELEEKLAYAPGPNAAQNYDRIVAFGELVGTRLVAYGLEHLGMDVEWLDVRHVIVTDSSHQSALVNWERSQRNADVVSAYFKSGERKVVLTQGFIARSKLGNTTTLGREGSDYTAAILAYLMDAADVTIWKDVPGMLNADPRWFDNTVEVPELSFREAIELSYYGASVIHPKTIQPLKKKQIPLFVKSFVDPSHRGTVIQESKEVEYSPMYILKQDQVLISVSPRDFSFIVESNLRDIFEALAQCGIRVNLMQNSAVSFSVCIDANPQRLEHFREMMSNQYEVRYNEGLQLLTIRHYSADIAKKLTEGKETLLEQRSRHTLRIVMR